MSPFDKSPWRDPQPMSWQHRLIDRAADVLLAFLVLACVCFCVGAALGWVFPRP